MLLAASHTASVHAQDQLQFTCGPSSGVIGEQSECVDATITYGTTTISAGRFRMSNLGTESGEWDLTAASIVTPEAELSADRALVKLESGKIVRFELTGSPSRIALIVSDNEMPVGAEADVIVYDLAADTLQLSGDVRFAFGDNTFDTCELAYNLNTRSYTSGNCGFRAVVPQPESEPDRPQPQRAGP